MEMETPTKVEWRRLKRYSYVEMQNFLMLIKKYERGVQLKYTHQFMCYDKLYILFTKDSVAESYSRKSVVPKYPTNKNPVPIVFKSAHDGSTKTVQFTLTMLESYYRAVLHRWPNFNDENYAGINKNVLIKENIENRYIGMSRYGQYLYQVHPPKHLIKTAIIYARTSGQFIEISEDDVFPQRQNMLRKNPKRSDQPKDAGHNVFKIK